MSSWKYSLELVTRELELTEKKKQALEDLFASERISQSTYDYLERELAEAIMDLGVHRKSLMEKMTARAEGLEKQIKSLELFLANLEIHHAAGEIEDETYEQQNKAILLGLEATKQELTAIKSSLMKLTPRAVAPEITEPENIEEEEAIAEENPVEESAENPTAETTTEASESEISPTSPSEEELDVGSEESTEF